MYLQVCVCVWREETGERERYMTSLSLSADRMMMMTFTVSHFQATY